MTARPLSLALLTSILEAAGSWRGLVKPFRIPALTVAALALLCAISLMLTGLTFTGIAPPIVLFVGVALAGTVSRLYGRSVVIRGDRRAGGAFERVGDAFGYLALTGAAALSLSLFSYACNAAAFPYQDEAFGLADGRLGFHWGAWAAHVDARPTLHWILATVYASHGVQTVAIFPILTFVSDRRRSLELFCTLTFATLIACLLSIFVPAIGGGPFAGVDMSWMSDLTAVRSGVTSFDFGKIAGIVQMPSCHVVIAVMITWAARRTGVFGWAVAALNAVMIVSALSEGGHYLVDVLAGFGLSLVVIEVAHRTIYGEPAFMR